MPRKNLPRPLQLGKGQRLVRRRPSLVQQYQNALNEANAANESRYQEILSGYDALRDRSLADVASVGQQQGADIDRTFRNQSSNVYNRLVNRGFGNSSLNATMQQGVERNRQSAHNRLNDSLVGLRTGLDTNITSRKLQAIEDRSDIGPDFNQLIALSQGLGRGGYGQQAYGGGGGGFGQQLVSGYNQMLAQHLQGGLRGGGGNSGFLQRQREKNAYARLLRRRRNGA